MNRRSFIIATSGFGILSSFKMFSQSAVAATFSIQENDVYIPADSISSLNISFSNFNINTANIDLSKPVEITVSAGKKGNSLTQIHSKLITLDSESEEISNQLMNYNLLDSETIPTDFSTLYNAGDSFDIIIEVEINHDDVNAQIIQEVFTANITPIVNGAIFEWKIREGSGETVIDTISSQDGVVNNSLWIQNENYVGGYALNSDGSNSVSIPGQWGDFGSNMRNDFAIALTVKTTDRGQLLGGYDSSSMRLELTTRADSDVPGDVLGIMIRDDDNKDGEISSNTVINDGKLHRCVLVKKTNNVNKWEIWIDGVKESVSVHRDAWGANTRNFRSNCHFFAVDKGNGTERHLNGTLDNIIFSTESITKEEIHNDYTKQPWVNIDAPDSAAYNWDINENSGPIIESKTSVESNLLPEGISWNSDSGLSYLEFNGNQNSGVDTNILPITGDGNRAFFMWVYLNDNSEGTFLEYGSSASNTQWRWRLISGDSRVENEDTGAEAALNIPTGKWIPIGITLNGNSLSDITFYVDGNTSTTNINSNINTGADNNLTFGFSPVNNTQNPLNGRIGSCIAWDTNVNTNIFDNIKDNTKYLYR